MSSTPVVESKPVVVESKPVVESTPVVVESKPVVPKSPTDRITELKSQKISILLKEAIANDEVDPLSPMEIIAKGMELLENLPEVKSKKGPPIDKKKVLIDTIKRVAIGADGISGTDDDIIPESCVKSLVTLINQDLIGDVTNVFHDISTGKFKLSSAIKITKKIRLACFPKKNKKITN